MFFRLLLLFALVPIIELALLIEVGRLLGTALTVLLVVSTGVAGAALARSQGAQTVRRLQRDLAAGTFPRDELINAALILAGGLLLLTPGLLTDTAGLLALVPGSRGVMRAFLTRAIRRRLMDRGTHVEIHQRN